MKNKTCAICNNPELHARGICKKCYNYAYYRKQHKLPKDELYDLIRTKYSESTKSNKPVEALPDIDLFDKTPFVTSYHTTTKPLYMRLIKKLIDFLLKIK